MGVGLVVSKKPKRVLTRRDFLKTAGVAGASLLGAAGCAGVADKMPRLPEEYLPGGGVGPNVILVIIDSLRKDHVGAYGNDWIETPALDALAEESRAFHPILPRGHAHNTGQARHPHRDENLAHPTELLRMEADTLQDRLRWPRSLRKRASAPIS